MYFNIEPFNISPSSEGEPPAPADSKPDRQPAQAGPAGALPACQPCLHAGALPAHTRPLGVGFPPSHACQFHTIQNFMQLAGFILSFQHCIAWQRRSTGPQVKVNAVFVNTISSVSFSLRVCSNQKWKWSRHVSFV